MNILDYIIIAFLLYLLIRGLFRGFIREIFSLAGVILGIWLGTLFQSWLTGIIKQHLPLPQYLPLVSFILIFFVILVACNIIGWALSIWLKKAPRTWPDMTSGAVLALLKGVIITYLAIILMTFYLPSKTPLIADSTLAPWIVKSYQRVTSIISPDHYKNLKDKIIGGSKKLSDKASDKIKDLVKDND
jgi:membrane protein required for colicin V production